jgi:hypothetical protein
MRNGQRRMGPLWAAPSPQQTGCVASQRRSAVGLGVSVEGRQGMPARPQPRRRRRPMNAGPWRGASGWQARKKCLLRAWAQRPSQSHESLPVDWSRRHSSGLGCGAGGRGAAAAAAPCATKRGCGGVSRRSAAPRAGCSAGPPAAGARWAGGAGEGARPPGQAGGRLRVHFKGRARGGEACVCARAHTRGAARPKPTSGPARMSAVQWCRKELLPASGSVA